MERKEIDPMIIDQDDASAMASGTVFPGEDAAQEHTQSSKGLSICADPGQSYSSIPSPGDEFYCPICMETVPSSCKFTVSSCDHTFCLSYIGQCPEPSCRDSTVEPEDCYGIIQPELFGKWGLALCDLALGKQRLYCPFSDCSVRGHHGSRVPPLPQACARCMVPWHGGIGCEEFQELGEDERSRENVMVRQLACEQKWQRCPHQIQGSAAELVHAMA
ncbi:hypothetical protein HU200_037524 [Digitaria exilis]|uniref:RING-type domain-containing protein n=1 Tax=Digitaria exilis TaxID=1010633 RepID=A0A835BD23_9POAL|nr:hypothetical protein HU200_037524 [Digitaria exilis]